MPNPQPAPKLTPTAVAIAESLVESMLHPAVIVLGSDEIVVANQQWIALLGPEGDTTNLPDLDRQQRWFDGIDTLAAHLAPSSIGSGSTPVTLKQNAETPAHAYIARWRKLGISVGYADLTLVLLEDHEEVRELSETVHAQSRRINQLLVRQIVLEERERRKLGTALHDHVSQALALARRLLTDEPKRAEGVTEAIALIDEAIVTVRDLSFTFSPPILEDLGLLPALRWLAEDLCRRHRIDAKFVDDGTEPSLSPDARTIAFRSVRELAMNAAKHAPGSELVISSLVTQRFCRLTVRDTGPGLNREHHAAHARGHASFGLLSVEQQILALGGSFELVSVPGEGLRAVLTLPLVERTVDVKPAEDRVKHA